MKLLFAIQDLINSAPLPHVKTQNFFQLGLNIIFSVAGAIAILIIVLSGMRLIFARDNPENISKARTSIVYAIIGLVIVASAAAMTNLIIVRLGK